MPEPSIEIGECKCQVHSVPRMGTRVRDPQGGLTVRVKLALKRTLGTRMKRRLKTMLDGMNQWLRGTRHPLSEVEAGPSTLRAGDAVRVRARESIEATLNSWNELKGCGFMDEMWQYCGTVQRVFKRVERFVDERDYTVKKVGGVVLLEGAVCAGTELYGRCDRSCFFFWREEWLEKIEANPGGVA